MAYADYRLCDICEEKSFYDSELNYDWDEYPETGLYNLGCWVCLCRKCSKKYVIKIEERILGK